MGLVIEAVIEKSVNIDFFFEPDFARLLVVNCFHEFEVWQLGIMRHKFVFVETDKGVGY
jgi:hypothetical protein